MAKKKSKEPVIREADRPVLDAVKALRKATGLTQEAAAERAGTSGQTVYNWERGEGLAAWAVRVRYLRALATTNRLARSVVLQMLGLPTVEEQQIDRQVALFVTRLEAARKEPGWDHLAFTLDRLLPGENPGELHATAV